MRRILALRGMQPVRGQPSPLHLIPYVALSAHPFSPLFPHFIRLSWLRGSNRSSLLNSTLPFTPSGSLLCLAVHLTLRILNKLKQL